jgi:phage gpG-like protein
MPPRGRGNPNLTPRQSVRRGLRMDEGIMQFEFKPTIGISAREIDRLGLDIRSMREPLKRVIQQVMAPSFRKNFDEEGRPDPWPEPAPETLDIRERMGFNGDMILDRTGLLKKTVQQLNLWTITETTATIRDLPQKIWYGKLHQAGYAGSGGGRSMGQYIKAAGGDAKKAFQQQDDDIRTALKTGQKAHGGVRHVGEIPARPFILIQEEDMDAAEEIFVRWLQERMVRSGFKPGVGRG